MPRTKNLYVVGYDHDRDCVYGREGKGSAGLRVPELAYPMTLKQAERYIKTLTSDSPKAIYKLVVVKRISRRTKREDAHASR